MSVLELHDLHVTYRAQQVARARRRRGGCGCRRRRRGGSRIAGRRDGSLFDLGRQQCGCRRGDPEHHAAQAWDVRDRCNRGKREIVRWRRRGSGRRPGGRIDRCRGGLHRGNLLHRGWLDLFDLRGHRIARGLRGNAAGLRGQRLGGIDGGYRLRGDGGARERKRCCRQ